MAFTTDDWDFFSSSLSIDKCVLWKLLSFYGLCERARVGTGYKKVVLYGDCLFLFLFLLYIYIDLLCGRLTKTIPPTKILLDSRDASRDHSRSLGGLNTR